MSQEEVVLPEQELQVLISAEQERAGLVSHKRRIIFPIYPHREKAARRFVHAPVAGLVIEEQVLVVPRAGKDVLFGVYVMRRTADSPAAARRLPGQLVVRDRAGQWAAEFAAVRASMGMPSGVD
jgi:hypothetical protein